MATNHILMRRKIQEERRGANITDLETERSPGFSDTDRGSKRRLHTLNILTHQKRNPDEKRACALEGSLYFDTLCVFSADWNAPRRELFYVCDSAFVCVFGLYVCRYACFYCSAGVQGQAEVVISSLNAETTELGPSGSGNPEVDPAWGGSILPPRALHAQCVRGDKGRSCT